MADIPIIFLTALNATEDIVKGFKVGEMILSRNLSIREADYPRHPSDIIGCG